MGVLPRLCVAQGEAADESTGPMMPHDAEATVMIETKGRLSPAIHPRIASSSNRFGRVELSGIVKMGLNLWRMQTMHKESPSEISPVIWVLPAFMSVVK